MPKFYWEREMLPVLEEAFVIYCNGVPMAFATDDGAAQEIVDALNNQED